MPRRGQGARCGAALGLVLLAACVWSAASQPAGGDEPGAGASDIKQISSYRGCGAEYLAPNMQDCVIDEFMGSNGTVSFGFRINPKTAQKHAVLLTLRSVGGAAVMRVYSASGVGTFNGHVVYFNDAVTESVLRMSAEDAVGGDYEVVVQGMGGATSKLLLYLRVQTPPAAVRLVPAERAAMQQLWKECCPVTTGIEAPDVCATFLPNALKATRPEEDLCNLGNFVCNAKGQLEKIDFSNAGLKCKSFPAAFGKFPALETLMLRYNSFNEDTFENVAKVLSNAKGLRRLMMGSTNITGAVPCQLFEEHEIHTIMFSINQLEGTLPACVLEHPSLQELYMSRTTLTGPLPDAIPENSGLVVWYAINRDPMTGQAPGPGFTGPLPASLAKAKALQFAELSGHQFDGDVPQLPPNIRMFEAHSNKLDGNVAAALPASLIYFDVSNNSLKGALPDFSAAEELTLLDMSRNQFTGPLPTSYGAAGAKLVYVDFAHNQLSGSVNDLGDVWSNLPALQYLFLQDNSLEGFTPASLAANQRLVALDMSTNRLSGDLEAFGAALEPPKKAPKASGTKGRKLAGCMHRSSRQHAKPAASADSSPAAGLVLARKFFGAREDWSALQPGGAPLTAWRPDWRALAAAARGQLTAARRSLLQTAGPQPEVPAPGPATTTVVTGANGIGAGSPPEAPAAAATAPPSGGAAPTVEPTPAASAPSMPPGGGASSSAAALGPGGGPRSGRGRDVATGGSGPMRSQLAGNSFLYLNLSSNGLTGPLPDTFANLEMMRSPANSSDPFDTYVYTRGGPDRVLDLTSNQLYGQFPRFLLDLAAGDIANACLCSTNFSVSAGNQLYCPTKAALQGFKATPSALDAVKSANYTCVLPNNPEPVSMASYLASPANYLAAIPAQNELPKPAEPRSRDIGAASGVPPGGAAAGAARHKPAPPLGPGAIAGIVIGGVAALAIIGGLAYLAYSKLWTVHRATSFKRGELPDGPGLDGHGAYPAAAYGGAANGAGGPMPVSSGSASGLARPM